MDSSLDDTEELRPGDEFIFILDSGQENLPSPEILKLSASTSDLKGGGELWIIGKNFQKDTKVVFCHSIAGKKEPLWTKLTEPEQEYFHQTHLITQIPPFYNLDTQDDVEVSVFIKCGEKLSDPLPFTYSPHSAQYMLPNALAKTHDVTLPRGVAPPAVAAKNGSVSVITGCDTNVNEEAQPQPKPTNKVFMKVDMHGLSNGEKGNYWTINPKFDDFSPGSHLEEVTDQ